MYRLRYALSSTFLISCCHLHVQIVTSADATTTAPCAYPPVLLRPEVLSCRMLQFEPRRRSGPRRLAYARPGADFQTLCGLSGELDYDRFIFQAPYIQDPVCICMQLADVSTPACSYASEQGSVAPRFGHYGTYYQTTPIMTVSIGSKDLRREIASCSPDIPDRCDLVIKICP